MRPSLIPGERSFRLGGLVLGDLVLGGSSGEAEALCLCFEPTGPGESAFGYRPADIEPDLELFEFLKPVGSWVILKKGLGAEAAAEVCVK